MKQISDFKNNTKLSKMYHHLVDVTEQETAKKNC